MVLRDNMFVEKLLPAAMFHQLTDVEMDAYRKPFLNPGEDRRPTLTMAPQLPLDGEPADVAKIVGDYAEWLKRSDIPKLWIHGDPGMIMTPRVSEFCSTWPNQTEVKVKGSTFSRKTA
jgi:haloalkane dehalogenase